LVNRLSKEIGAEVKVTKTYTKKRKEPYINAVIEIKNKHLIETLINNFGGDKKPLRYKYEVPNELKSHFVRGYYDGDGSLSYYSDGTWELGISGYEPILKKIINDVGIETNITKDKSIKRIRLRRTDYITKFLNYIYNDLEDNPPYLRRKHEQMIKFMDSLK